MPYIALSLIIKLILIIHIVKTERNTVWIWIVLIVPIAGPLAYFIVEIWPELAQTRAGYDAKRAVATAIMPNKKGSVR